MSLGWYLARTKPMSEYLALAALERNGYKSYLPRVQTPRPRAGHEDIPLFPGYLFIRQGRNGSGLPAINRMAGIVGWVQFDGEIPEVPGDVIAKLDRRLKAINRHGGHWTRYKPGQKVRVSSGWMEGLAEVLEETKTPQSRVRVLMNFMGQLVQAHVPWQDLRPVDDDAMLVQQERAPRRTRGNGRWIRGFGPRAIAGISTSRG